LKIGENMIFTRSTGYALLALTELALLDKAIDTNNLSKRIGVSKYFLAKLLQILSKKEIVKSFKGVNGGFILNKNPKDILIVDIFKCVEDRDYLVYECAKKQEDCPNNRANVCSIWPFLNLLEDNIYEFLSKFTLEDVLRMRVC
jgi:Rrf2 family iron-sulfur cluster assembly transcriptional regulator